MKANDRTMYVQEFLAVIIFLTLVVLFIVSVNKTQTDIVDRNGAVISGVDRSIRQVNGTTTTSPPYYEEQEAAIIDARSAARFAWTTMQPPLDESDDDGNQDQDEDEDQQEDYNDDYGDDYDNEVIDGRQSLKAVKPWQGYADPTKGRPSTSASNETGLWPVWKQLKVMWDVYRAMSAAWTTLSSRTTTAGQQDIGAKNAVTLAADARTKPASTSLAKIMVERSTAEQGRYIKGDPLKGYYDFIITEGSYKFWAVFQVATAVLIIYSTFAAIYYSKVNPLVSDYDYTDYLGGARSTGVDVADLDFVDEDGQNGNNRGPIAAPWSEWLPNTGHSMQFILDAIDRLPVDHSG